MVPTWFVTISTQLLGLLNKLTPKQIWNGHEVSRKSYCPQIELCKEYYPNGFQMPFHYPPYKKADYEKMEDWKLGMLLGEYVLKFRGNLDEKRAFAKQTFLWPDQLCDVSSSILCQEEGI